MTYEQLYSRSLADPEGFWGEAARSVHWEKPWERVLDDSNPPLYRWFKGGELNTCYNALDRHVESGRGDQAALIYDSPVTDSKSQYTYSQLLSEVARCAGLLYLKVFTGCTNSSATSRDWKCRHYCAISPAMPETPLVY